MANLKMVSPWIDYYHMVQAMFAEDKNVIVVFDEEDVTLKLYPGYRHELLNETGREAVYADLLAWISDRIKPTILLIKLAQFCGIHRP